MVPKEETGNLGLSGENEGEELAGKQGFEP